MSTSIKDVYKGQPFEGGVAGPLFKYDTNPDTGRGGRLKEVLVFHVNKGKKKSMNQPPWSGNKILYT